MNKNRITNKKGQIFVISIVIAVSIALGTSYILLKYMYDSPAKDQAIGRYQSAVVESLSTANSVNNYVSTAYSLSINNAIYEYLYENPKPSLGSLNEDGGVDISDFKYCGNYIYRIWNSIDKDCYPDINSKDFEMNKLIDSNLISLTLMQKHATGVMKESFWNTLDQAISYDYTYDIVNDKTKITAKANENYKVYMFNTEEAASDSKVIQYLNDKKYSYAAGSGDISGVPFIPAGQRHYKVSDGTRDIKYIIIHATAGSTIEGAELTFQDPTKETSAHYIVGSTRDNYGVIQMVLEKDIAHHAGCRISGTENVCGKEEYTKGMNTASLGIEVVNIASCNIFNQQYGDNLNCEDTKKYECKDSYFINGIDYLPGKNCWEKYPTKQYEKVVALTALLAKKHNVPVTRTNILGHVELLKIGTGHVDPGPLMDMDTFVNDVQAKMSEDESVLISIINSGNTIECIKNGDVDWSFGTVYLSSNKLTTTDVLKINTEVKNEGDSCVDIQSEISVSYKVSGKDYLDTFSINTNSYHGTDKIPTTKIEMSCSFTTDEKIYNDKKGTGCILLVPNDGSENFYTMEYKLSDGSDTKPYGEKLSFSVKKSSSATELNLNNALLTTEDKKKIELTKKRLEELNILEYINEEADKKGVPRHIILALITQESNGDMNAGSSAAAYGLGQFVQSTFESPNLKFEDKCSWDEYLKDPKCQVRASIAYLKNNYDSVGGKTLYYECNVNCYGTNSAGKLGWWSSCSNGCDQNKCMGPIDKQYTGWEAALRRYNGGGDTSPPASGKQSSGCQNQPDYEYVETIMRLSTGWGNTEQADQIIKEEVNQGVLGTYIYKNSMEKTIDINFELFNVVSNFAKNTVTDCSKGVSKVACINEKVIRFNNNLNQKYKNDGVLLKTQCDENSEILKTNKFIEELNDCAMSNKDNCKCKFTDNDVQIIIMESSEDSTKIIHTSDGIHKAYFDYKISDPLTNTAIHKNSVNQDYLKFYKQNGEIYQGAPTDMKDCSVSKTIYRLCLDTNYNYRYYDKDKDAYFETKFKIPFAITLRDGVPPKIISGLEQFSLENDKNAIVLKWTRGIEEDITGYNIYFSDSSDSLLNAQTVDLKNDYFIYVDTQNNQYETYKSIDLNNQKCNIKELDGSKYCEFKYDAIDKDGNKVEISLSKEKPYYLIDEDKFLYIVDGRLPNNKLENGVNKYVAITAIDVENMELDNVAPEQKFSADKNIIQITPMDKLSPGLVTITSAQIEKLAPPSPGDVENEILRVGWENVKVYIDGTPITTNPQIRYILNTAMTSCATDTIEKNSIFDKTEGPYGDLEVNIDITGEYVGCVGVSSLFEISSEQIMYDSVISRSLN